MPKVVDKVQKRKDIALACSELLLEVGIRKLTVEQVAKAAKIGKGTVYEYFENKDDIVFEIINIYIQEYHEQFAQNIKKVENTRNKISYFFEFVLSDEEENLKHLNGYKEYLSIMLNEENPKMKAFNENCDKFFNDLLKNIIKEGIKKGELIPNSVDFVDIIQTFEKGTLLTKMTRDNYDVRTSCENFIKNVFDFIEIKRK